MSDDSKFFARPKVRFNQISNSEHSKQNIGNQHSAVVIKQNRPKIKSVVPVKQTIRIVKDDNLPLDENLKLGADMERKQSVIPLPQTDNNSDLCLFSELQTSSSSNGCLQTDVENLANNVNNIGNLKSMQKLSDTSESNKISSQKNSRGTKSCSVLFSRKPLDETNEIKNKLKSALLKDCKRKKQQVEKENQETNIQKNITHQQESKKRSNKSEPAQSNLNSKFHSVPKIAKEKTSTIASCVTSKVKDCTIKSSGSVSADVMPCLKNRKVKIKSKSVPVKKTVLRDVLGHKIKPYVGPGILKGIPSQLEMTFNFENVNGKSGIVPTEKFSKPEFNSIKCTINKLNELKKEKIVADKEHLPTAYRHLLNRKISTALDFLPDEAIYTNLVDLSIDEKVLPTRLIRSKDPEPRQRDIVPKLSDFFKPEPTEEYCTPVLVKLRNFEIQENWSAFRISDKIFEWKSKIDHDE